MSLMGSNAWASLATRLKRHEGFRQHVYDDATGKPILPGTVVAGHPTIGYGIALDRRGITESQAWALSEQVLIELYAEMGSRWPWMLNMTDARQGVVVEMLYQLGVQGVQRFTKFLSALKRGLYAQAAEEMLDSKWAKDDSPGRALALAYIMAAGGD